jgi:pimeloyl-ACP methyl ester carboxylesterase
MPALAERDSRELAALTRLTLDELGNAAAGIGQVHRAIAGRAFGASGAGATPARRIHDAVARNVYGGLRLGAGAAGRAAAAVVGPRAPISVVPRGAAILAAIDGLVGDVLESERAELAPPMSLRVGGRIAQVADIADPGPQVAVFLHGLMETEFSWGPQPYGDDLPGWTPLYVRYNSGRRISHNGASLDELLEQVLADWPVEIERIALVGHSMGGLVARSACHTAALRGADWVSNVRHVVSLGTPHMGAPLEQSVHYLSAALSALPETKPLGAFFRRRSGGIRDLRQGSLVDADWTDCDPDALRARACEEVPLLQGATHCFVSATITRDPGHPVGRLLGDCLVLVPSASGRSRTQRLGFRDCDGMHVGGATHFALLRHPKVHAQLKTWLA